MISGKHNIIRGRHRFGRYCVTPHAQNPRALVEWIEARRYLDCESQAHLLKQRNPGRAKNKLFEMQPAFHPRPAVMKVCSVDPRYRWRRQAELFIRQWFRDYNRTAFRGCCALFASGAPVAAPLAWWQHHESLWRRKTYFLYQKVPAQMSVRGLLAPDREQQMPPDVCHALAAKITAAIRDIHATHWRHNDMQPGNILTTLPQSFDADTIRNTPICIVDYDHCAPVRLRWSAIRRFFDLKCLSQVRLPHVSDAELLAYYSKGAASGAASAFWLFTLKFWKRGGFNIARQIRGRRPQRTRGAHLKPRHRA